MDYRRITMTTLEHIPFMVYVVMQLFIDSAIYREINHVLNSEPNGNTVKLFFI